MLGSKLRELRETNGLVQRQIAAQLEVDTAYISKVENEEKPLSKIHLAKIAHLFKISEKELLKMWLADKIYELINNEDNALEVIKSVQQELIRKSINQETKKIAI
jgi:HTH-type transcriptional regulator, competence development regulator